MRKINSIIKSIDEYMKGYDGVVAYACSQDDMFWQDNESILMYDAKGKSKEGLHTRKSDLFADDIIVDTEYNPGHSHIANGIWFGSCWRMWFGKKYFTYIPKKALVDFCDCYENKEIGNGCIRITLYENLWGYDKKENRAIQINFRKSVGIDEIASRIECCEGLYTDADSAIEILEGSFEHGGIKLIKYYYNSKKELTVKSKAAEVITYELGVNGDSLWSETGKIN